MCSMVTPHRTVARLHFIWRMKIASVGLNLERKKIPIVVWNSRTRVSRRRHRVLRKNTCQSFFCSQSRVTFFPMLNRSRLRKSIKMFIFVWGFFWEKFLPDSKWNYFYTLTWFFFQTCCTELRKIISFYRRRTTDFIRNKKKNSRKFRWFSMNISLCVFVNWKIIILFFYFERAYNRISIDKPFILMWEWN